MQQDRDSGPPATRKELFSWLGRHGPTGPAPEQPLLVRNAEGVRIETDDGKVLLDFSQGEILPLGYNHPCVRQATSQCAVASGLEWPERIALMRKLAEIVPGGMNRRVMLCDSGREALAQAVSLACRETACRRVVYLTEMESERPDFGSDVAAVVAHPLDPRMTCASEFCRKSGALLIDDEGFVAPGVTGRMFAVEHSGTRPDVYVLGRGLAAGMPFGACVTNRSTLRWPSPGPGGSPGACMAALEYIRLLEAGLLDSCRALGVFLCGRLRELSGTSKAFEVVGAGLALGLRFGKAGQAAGFRARCRHGGLILGRMGDRTVGVSPALLVNESELGSALAIMEKALSGGGADLPQRLKDTKKSCRSDG